MESDRSRLALFGVLASRSSTGKVSRRCASHCAEPCMSVNRDQHFGRKCKHPLLLRQLLPIKTIGPLPLEFNGKRDYLIIAVGSAIRKRFP